MKGLPHLAEDIQPGSHTKCNSWCNTGLDIHFVETRETGYEHYFISQNHVIGVAPHSKKEDKPDVTE